MNFDKKNPNLFFFLFGGGGWILKKNSNLIWGEGEGPGRGSKRILTKNLN